MSRDAEDILRRLSQARTERQRFEPIYDDAIRLTMPGRQRFYNINPVETAEDIFDETGANAVTEFVSRMLAGVAPPFTEFVKLEASSMVDPRDIPAVNRDLAEIGKFMFEEIWASNFMQEASESFFDMAYSTGTLLVEEGTGGMALQHKAIPMTECYFEAAPDGLIGGLFRVCKVPANEVEQRYRRAKLKPETAKDLAGKKDKISVVEYTYREWGAANRSRHIVVLEEKKEVIVDRPLSGLGSDPFIKFRWGTTAGEVMGRGPLMNALAAIRTTNLMVELVLENAAMSIVGIYQTDNDATVNADQVHLLPGTIIAKEIGTKGLEAVQGATGNFNMQDVVLGDQRMNIKRALFNDMLSDPNKTPATAYEVSERMADLAYRSSTGFSRLFYEFVQPYIRRVLYILQKRGDIQLPVKGGRAISFRAVSPLAQAQQGRELQALMQGHQIVAAMFGPQAAAAQYDLEKLLPWIQLRGGVNPALYKKPGEVVAAITEAGQQMADMQAAANGTQAPQVAP
jgi:hypothetical protein